MAKHELSREAMPVYANDTRCENEKQQRINRAATKRGEKKKRMRNEQGDCFSVDAIAASCLLCFHTPRGVIYFLDERDGGDRLPADAASLDAVEMRGDVRCLGLMFERCSVFRALVFCLVFLCCQKLRFPGLFVVRLPVQ